MRRTTKLKRQRSSSRGRLALFLAGGIVTAILLVVVLVSLDQHSPVQSALPEPPAGASPKASTPVPPSPVPMTDEPPSTPAPETTSASSVETFTFYETLEQRSTPSPGFIDKTPKPSSRPPAPTASSPGPAAVSPKKQPLRYTIQIAALKDRPTAEALADRLKGKGYPVFILPHVVPGQGTWYRVRVGHFTKREAAQEVARQLSRREQLTTYIAKE